MKNKHALVLASIVLATDIVRFATKLVDLLGMIFYYPIAYATDVGIKVRTETRRVGVRTY